MLLVPLLGSDLYISFLPSGYVQICRELVHVSMKKRDACYNFLKEPIL